MYHKAATSLDNRDLKLQEVAELIERDMFLIGATAIEDKLQIVYLNWFIPSYYKLLKLQKSI